MPRWAHERVHLREGDKVLWYGRIFRIITLPEACHIVFGKQAIGIGVFRQAFKFETKARCWKIKIGFEPLVLRFITNASDHPSIAPKATTELVGEIMARKPKRQNYTFVVVTQTFNYTSHKCFTRAEADQMFDCLCGVSDVVAVTMHEDDYFINGWCSWASLERKLE